VSAEALRGEAFVVYAADAADDGLVSILRQLLKEEPRVLHRVPNTLTVLTLVAAGMGLALVPALWRQSTSQTSRIARLPISRCAATSSW
jgi:DNA-binding transcriptional LysR family regulator